MKNKRFLYTLSTIVIAFILTLIITHFLLQKLWPWSWNNFLTFAIVFIIAYSFATNIKDNLEILVIAFIFAMIIRCFCIEVYKIPTGSMEPTLRGERNSPPGDRILANKFIYLFRPIHRFDVVLFKFPLDKTKNFVKRVVGLPNEEFMVQNGDIYYKPRTPVLQKDLPGKPQGENNFIIAKKPLKVQESIWIPVWLWSGGAEKGFWKNFRREGKGKVEWQISSLPGGQTGPINASVQEPKIYLESLSDEYFLAYAKSIKDRYHSDGGTYDVPDVKIAFKCYQVYPAGEIQVQLKTGFNTFILHLGNLASLPVPPGPSGVGQTGLRNSFQIKTNSFLEHINYKKESKVITIPRSFKPKTEHLVEIMNFDGTFYIKQDKKIILKYDYQTVFDKNMLPDWEIEKSNVSVGVVNSGVYLWDIRLYRDIYYYPQGILVEKNPLIIPDKKYFMIGDHVPNSKDSRLWKMKRMYLKNGEIIECDINSFYNEPDHFWIRKDRTRNKGGDIWGRDLRIKKDTVLKTEENYYSFVDETEIFGKGLMVYWPLGRLKMIR